MTSTPAQAAAVSPDDMRGVLRAFATGVTVVTSDGPGGPYGVTANAFASVSLDPPLVLVCLSAMSAGRHAIQRNGVFAVSVLNAGQEWLARRFASPDRPRGAASLDGIPHRCAATGAPILDDATGWLDCRVARVYSTGDHVIVLGEVLDLGGDPNDEPLVFHDGRYRAVRDREAAVPA